MKVLIQRVLSSSVRLIKDGKIKEEVSIGKGLLLFVGIGKNDDEDKASFLAQKIFTLRIFENKGKFDLSLRDIKGEVLVVPQFTLYGDAEKGRRPDFTSAERPERAKKLFDFFCEEMSKYVLCKKGFFGEKMEVELINDGPVTLMVEK
ncbi:MAG: D-aminoacyl-tRNA deacylase [candidate division WOR-3 bacterium]